MMPTDVEPWHLYVGAAISLGLIVGAYLIHRQNLRRRSPLSVRNAGLKPSKDIRTTPPSRRPSGRSSIPDATPIVGLTSANRSELQALERHLQLAILDQTARERLIASAMREVGGDRRLAIRKVLKDLEDDNEKYR